MMPDCPVGTRQVLSLRQHLEGTQSSGTAQSRAQYVCVCTLFVIELKVGRGNVKFLIA